MLRLLVLLVIPMLIQACAYQLSSEPSSHRMTSYRDPLADAIHRSDSVRIIERSHPSDTVAKDGKATLKKPHRIYRQVDLSPEAARFLEHAVRSLPATVEEKGIPTRCAFVDHHAIEFRSRGKTTSTLRICFQCGDILWDGSNRLPPEDLLGALRRFLISQGFQPERDWKALAR